MKLPYILFCTLASFAVAYADCINNVSDIRSDVISMDISSTILNSSDEELINAISSWLDVCSANGGTYHAGVKQSDGCLRLSCVNVKQENMERVANAAKEREQSLRNRLLTGASIGLTGFGGMELMSGLAEQNADAAAQTDMTAYLQTFSCKYGDVRVPFGSNQNELPGASSLFSLYQEYKTLASDLKERKEQLGLQPGIESEVVMDSSQTGLYDDASIGITNGTFASLYRAAMGNQTDKDKLNKQQQQTEDKIQTGTLLTISGIAVGLLGNILDETLADNALDEEAEYDKDGFCVNNCPAGFLTQDELQEQSYKSMQAFLQSLRNQQK